MDPNNSSQTYKDEKGNRQYVFYDIVAYFAVKYHKRNE